MSNRTLADEIITIIEANANNNPAPVLATVTKVYTDNCIDARLSNSVYKYIRTIGEPVLDTNVVIVFTDEEVPVAVCGNVDLSDYYTREEVDDIIEEIGSGEIDLSGYVKTEDLDNLNIDLDLSFGISGRDDSIIIDLDIVNGEIIDKIINIGD